MGSGTTLVETVKLGGRAIGQDINPVAYFLVKCALSSKAQIERLRDVGRRLSRNDVRIVVMAHLLREASCSPTLESALRLLVSASNKAEMLVDSLHATDS